MTHPAADDALSLTISKDFRFEAAHRFTHMPADHPFSRLHGHSFEGTVTLEGAPAADTGFVHDFWALDDVLARALEGLDHGLLNDVPGLENPSLENIARLLFQRIAPHAPGLVAVEVRRPSCGERAIVRRLGKETT